MKRIQQIGRFALTVATLTGIWAMLSGKFDALHFGAGFVVATLLSLFYFPWDREKAFPLMRFAMFAPWQLWQIFISNLRVARLVLLPHKPIRPVFIRRKPLVHSDRALTLLGCAITLTPGTLMLEAEEDHVLVHALDPASANDINAFVMDRRVGKVFGESREENGP